MKKILFFLSCMLLLASCQKLDDNGDLGGNWKMLQLEEFERDTVIDTRQDDRFWAIQLDLMQLTGGHTEGKGRFQHVGDSLYVQMIYIPVNYRYYGLYNPKDDRFEVIHLDRKKMILKSKYVKLDFRKF